MMIRSHGLAAHVTCWALVLAGWASDASLAYAQGPAGAAEEPDGTAGAPAAVPGATPAAPAAVPGATDERLDQPAPAGVAGKPEKPWNRGVPMAQRLRARAIYHQGNSYLSIPLFAQAAEKYQEALALYPHPAIYYNLALAQLNLVQPVDAYRSFSRALEHGPGPISEEHHQRGLQYLERLEKQLGHIEIVCAQPGAEVTMDGRPLFTGPGRHQGVVVPGEHQLLASEDGFIPAAQRVVVSAGERARVTLVLQRPVRTVTERYMPAWIPWASLGLGAAVLGVGGYYDGQASASWASFDDYVEARCPAGCTDIEAPEVAPRRAQATRDTRMTQGFYVAGGVVLAGSAVLLYVNRERVVRLTVEDSISILPMVAPDGAGITAQGHF
jgi:hypothetical protein